MIYFMYFKNKQRNRNQINKDRKFIQFKTTQSHILNSYIYKKTEQKKRCLLLHFKRDRDDDDYDDNNDKAY